MTCLAVNSISCLIIYSLITSYIQQTCVFKKKLPITPCYISYHFPDVIEEKLPKLLLIKRCVVYLSKLWNVKQSHFPDSLNVFNNQMWFHLNFMSPRRERYRLSNSVPNSCRDTTNLDVQETLTWKNKLFFVYVIVLLSWTERSWFSSWVCIRFTLFLS